MTFGKNHRKNIAKITSTIAIMTGANTARIVPTNAMTSSTIDNTQFETGSGETLAPSRTAAFFAAPDPAC